MGVENTDVSGLDVAVHHSRPMRVFEAERDSDQDLQPVLQGQVRAPANHPVQVLAGEELLDHVGHVPLESELVHERDVGVLEPARDLRLTEESVADVLASDLARLDGDVTPDERVPGLVDRPEASRSDLLDDLVLADAARRSRGAGRADFGRPRTGVLFPSQPEEVTQGHRCRILRTRSVPGQRNFGFTALSGLR